MQITKSPQGLLDFIFNYTVSSDTWEFISSSISFLNVKYPTARVLKVKTEVSEDVFILIEVLQMKKNSH